MGWRGLGLRNSLRSNSPRPRSHSLGLRPSDYIGGSPAALPQACSRREDCAMGCDLDNGSSEKSTCDTQPDE